MSKIKTLYLHGLDSLPVSQKNEMMEKVGFEVFAPKIDYRIEKNNYQNLRQKIIERKIEFLIGSSLGGYISFWLGEDLGLPCLLYNPAMTYSNQLDAYIPEIALGKCPARFIVIGNRDEVVDPNENLNFFRQLNIDNCYQRIIVCEWLAHQIDFQSFEELIAWAATSYRVFKKSL